MSAPTPPEPLEVLGIRIPWNEEKQGWLFRVLSTEIGIERYATMSGSPCYRYMRLSGGAWTSSEDLEFSIQAMEKELERLARNEMLVELLMATRRKIEGR